MNRRGFVMTELLVALLVLAVAVTAALALALRGFASTAEARRADIAAGLAADLAGRMRSLQAVDWTVLPAPADCTAACSPQQLAALELADWQAMVAAALPAGTGQLETAGMGDFVAVLGWTETGDVRRELRLGIGR